MFNVNSSNLSPELRKWGGERFAALGDMIIRNKPDTTIFFIGSAREYGYTESVAKKMEFHDRAVNLAGKTGVRELLNLIGMADVFVSCDSGPVHLAALTNSPVVAIFGPETPLLYEPLSENCYVFYKGDLLNCSPCMTVYNGKRSSCSRSRVNYKECMKLVTVNEVYDKVSEYFSLGIKPKIAGVLR